MLNCFNFKITKVTRGLNCFLQFMQQFIRGCKSRYDFILQIFNLVIYCVYCWNHEYILPLFICDSPMGWFCCILYLWSVSLIERICWSLFSGRTNLTCVWVTFSILTTAEFMSKLQKKIQRLERLIIAWQYALIHEGPILIYLEWCPSQNKTCYLQTVMVVIPPGNSVCIYGILREYYMKTFSTCMCISIQLLQENAHQNILQTTILVLKEGKAHSKNRHKD